jgi:hypothetical protein
MHGRRLLPVTLFDSIIIIDFFIVWGLGIWMIAESTNWSQKEVT